MVPSLVSINTAACWLRSTPGRIRRLAAELGIEPAASINGVEHLAETDVERVAECLAQARLADATIAGSMRELPIYPA
jgi:hypothetical protein